MSDTLMVAEEEWDRFFHLDNQDSLLESVSSTNGKPNEFETSPSVPSLDFTLHSAGTSSPSESDNFTSQYSPVYQIPDSVAISTPTIRVPTAKKRKLATDGSAAPPPVMGRQPRGQKISHNVIEKRYRSNLNDKIAKLRDSVPELRTAIPTVKRRAGKSTAGSDSEGSGGEDGSQGLKFNKATVLTKATEYIQQLERQNQKLIGELSQLRNRSGPMEKLRNPPAITTSFSNENAASLPTVPEVTVTPGSPNIRATNSTSSGEGLIKVPEEVRRLREQAKPSDHYASSLPGFTVDGDKELAAFDQPVKGLIGLPEDMRRLREQAAAQDHFAPESSYYSSSALASQDEFVEDDGQQSAWPRSKVLSRVLVGSLAALMVMEGFTEPDASSRKNEKRGLFSLPTELVTESRGFRAQIRQRIISFAASPASSKVLPLLALCAVFFALCLIVFVRIAPKGSKAVREGPPMVHAATQSGVSTPSPNVYDSGFLAPPPANRTYCPPPSTPIEAPARPWNFDLLERLAAEWFGLSWTASRVDEEAFGRRSRGRLWASLRDSSPKLLFEKRPS